MKKITTAVALSLSLISASAFAANHEPDNAAFHGVYGTNASTLTRAEVVQQLQQAQAAGQISNAEPDNVAFQQPGNVGSSETSVAVNDSAPHESDNDAAFSANS